MWLLITYPGHVYLYSIHHVWSSDQCHKQLTSGSCDTIASFLQHLNTLWPQKITRQIWGIWKLRPAYSPEMPNLGQNRWCFVPCDLEIWWMTLENNRAHLICYFKLYASFRSHWWFKTGVTVRKCPIWVKIDDFFSRVTLKFDVWPWKTIGHLYCATSSSMHHFVSIGEFKLEL